MSILLTTILLMFKYDDINFSLLTFNALADEKL